MGKYIESIAQIVEIGKGNLKAGSTCKLFYAKMIFLIDVFCNNLRDSKPNVLKKRACRNVGLFLIPCSTKDDFSFLHIIVR
jgi:hypothetical protein